jgi:DNA-binding NarL/FixJ family response regulator
MLIETQDDMEVVGQAGSFASALTAVEQEKPDLVILDLDLGGIGIVERLPELLSASKDTRVLVLTGVHDAQLHRRAMRLGAMGLILKDQASETVLKAIRRVYAGEAWVDRSMTASLLAEISGVSKEKGIDREAAKIEMLSRREREIITVLCEGMSNKQIAGKLFISEATVRNHLTSILAKLELPDRFALAIFSYRYGLAKPPH